GHLSVSALNYERGRLTSAGRFTGLPVRPFVAIAGGPAAMAGTLRLTGQWSIESAAQLTGSLSVARESGDLALGPERNVAPGLSKLALEAKATERATTFQLDVRSVYATA